MSELSWPTGGLAGPGRSSEDHWPGWFRSTVYRWDPGRCGRSKGRVQGLLPRDDTWTLLSGPPERGAAPQHLEVRSVRMFYLGCAWVRLEI